MPLKFESIPYFIIPLSVQDYNHRYNVKVNDGYGGWVARCKEKFVLLQNWSNEINIAQLSLKYGTTKLQVQIIKPLASIIFFFLIPYYLRISIPLADFRIKINIMSKIRINTDFSIHLATLLWPRLHTFHFNRQLGRNYSPNIAPNPFGFSRKTDKKVDRPKWVGG